MKITRRMEWPEPRDLTSIEELSDYAMLLYQALTEESALRAVELDVAYTDGYNVILGHEAGISMAISLDDTEGIYNVFIGHQAGYLNTTGFQNIGIGYKALYSNTKNASNIAIGSDALRDFNRTAGAGENVAIGRGAMRETTTGIQNTAIGAFALGSGVTTGNLNVAVGRSTLPEVTSGNDNTAVGASAGGKMTEGEDNTAIGRQALYELTTSDSNTALGFNAGYSCVTGAGNVFIGNQSAYNETGSNKLYIANTNTATPLIYGEFPNTLLKLNADVYIPAKLLVLDKASDKGIKVDTTSPTYGWRDLLGDVFARNTGQSKPSFTGYRDFLLDYQFAVGDEEYFKFHIPHDYVAGTDIHLHVHWSHVSADVNGGTVTFEYEISYAKGHSQAIFGASVGTTFPGTAATGAGGQYKHVISEVQISAATPDGNQIDSDDLEPDGVIMARLDLNANNMTGATPEPFIHFVDIHYQSTNIGTKNKINDFYA